MRSDVGMFGIMMWEVMNSVGRGMEAVGSMHLHENSPVPPFPRQLAVTAPYATIPLNEVLNLL